METPTEWVQIVCAMPRVLQQQRPSAAQGRPQSQPASAHRSRLVVQARSLGPYLFQDPNLRVCLSVSVLPRAFRPFLVPSFPSFNSWARKKRRQEKHEQ